ncbi:MAG: hypothetical protein KA104_01350 [Candidatus Pacebacteria bacterium]|nr:hypothetical protein [Candidatus Paceibacterota bacterium]
MILKDLILFILGTAGLLLVPFLGNWSWTLSDYAVAGTLLFGVGVALNLLFRKAGKYRIPAAIVVVALFVWLWAELAVGIFTNWGS